MGLVLIASSSAQSPDAEPAGDPIGPRLEDGSFGDGSDYNATFNDDDPRIYIEEIAAPAMDSRDPAWEPIYASHSGEVGPGRGADSLSCEGRRACEDYKAVEVAKTTTSPSSTQTSTTKEAPR